VRHLERFVVDPNVLKVIKPGQKFDEHLHPRDDHGRFAETPGAGIPNIPDVFPGESEAGLAGSEKLHTVFASEINRTATSVGGVSWNSPGVAQKIDNVDRIGAALAERAKTDPALKAQLDTVGGKYLEQGRAYVDEMHPQEGPDGKPLTGTQYMREHLQYIEGMSATEVGGREIAAKLQDTWMNSASDSSPMSWGLQLAAADRLGVDATEAVDFIAEHPSPGGEYGVALGVGTDPSEGEWPTRTLAQAVAIANSPAVKAYVDEVYSSTQALLKKDGITEVTVYRGVNFLSISDPIEGDGVQKVVLNPLSSFSLSESTASQFASGSGNSYILTESFPAERVFSLAMTGPGCLNETELLIIGGGDGDEAAVRSLDIRPASTFDPPEFSPGID
jgi:Dinitrogenase reductase ADP-ribosyltransferase (DRAT)